MKKRNPSPKRFFSAVECTRYYPCSLFCILVFGVFLSSCSGRSNEEVVPTMISAPKELTFEQHKVETGTAKHQTVLTGFILGNDFAEIAVVNVGENDDRHLRIHTFNDGTWVTGA